MIEQKEAFTMIELVMVIVVVGILAIMAFPRLDRDLREEAITDILGAIRYTQHLALIDDKHIFNNPKWHQRYWKIFFAKCAGANNWFYMIGSDSNMDSNGRFERSEASIDASTGLPYFWKTTKSCDEGGDGSVSPDIFLSKKYGIDSIDFSGGCRGTHYLGFDRFGRVHIHFGASSSPDYSSYMRRDCKITFSFKDSSIKPFIIIVTKETGYAYLKI